MQDDQSEREDPSTRDSKASGESSGEGSPAPDQVSPRAPQPAETEFEFGSGDLPETRPADNHDSATDSGLIAIPSQLGKYRIQEAIGRGGMGIVWKAIDPDLRRAVAIKILSEDLAASPTARRRFQREARAAAAINHPSVLTIHSVEDHDQMLFLVMEYVEGQSLKEYIADEEKLGSVEVIRLGCQIAQGLAAAHAQGVIHRDVKPGNVLLHDGATRARLSDFGLARVTFDNSDLTPADQWVGTPAYMAPEALRGDAIDARSDLFSLGCVLFHMVIGYPPFQGRSQGEVILKVISEETPSVRTIDPSVPPVLADVIDRLLRQSPDDRIQSAAEVADVLGRVQNELNQARTDDIAHVLAQVQVEATQPGGGVGAERPPQKGKQPVIWALVAVVILAAAGVAAPMLSLGLPFWGDSGSGETTGDSNSDEPSRLKEVVVSTGGGGDTATISEALEMADVGATIRVLGPGPYRESALIEGALHKGVRLVADPPATWIVDGQNAAGLTIRDGIDIDVSGFEFQVLPSSARALRVDGNSGDVRISDCQFRFDGSRQSVSMVLVETRPADPSELVRFEDCQFRRGGGTGACLAIGGSSNSETRIECSGSTFEGNNTLVYATQATRELCLHHNVFLGGQNAINVSYGDWNPENRIRVYNNTFVGSQYWLGLMNSFRGASATEPSDRCHVVNNLVLGGERVQGADEQWLLALDIWKFGSNIWESDDTTNFDAGWEGRLATVEDDVAVPIRSDPKAADFLVPAGDSVLLTSGVGGEFPDYVGALLTPK